MRAGLDKEIKSAATGLETFVLDKTKEGLKKKWNELTKEPPITKPSAQDLMDWSTQEVTNDEYGLTEDAATELGIAFGTEFHAVNNANDAFHGKVTIDGRKYGIVECSYEFMQSCDATGKPSGRVQGGRFTFTMPSTSDDDKFFYAWMFDKTKTYNGTFSFVVWARQNKRVYKNVNFVNAYCVALRDYFNDSDSKLMYTTVTIVAESIIFGNQVDGSHEYFSHEWTTKK